MIGIDILEVSRLADKEQLARKVLSDSELQYLASKGNNISTFAGLYCAKEAVLKALGTGIGNGSSVNDITITHDSLGQPQVTVSGGCQQRLHQLGYCSIVLSISHTATTAVAVAVLVK